MISNAEIRIRSRQIMKSKWIWRIVTVAICLTFIQNTVLKVLDFLYRSRGIVRMEDYLQSRISALQQGMDYVLPNAAARSQMLGGFCFELFITYVFTSITAYGLARTLLKSTSGDENRWFVDSLDGFRRPLETAWLMALMNIKATLWFFLFIIPGFVAIYRYRLAWYLKSEHTDWSAGRCIAESGSMMFGCKWQAFCLDVSFLSWFVLAGVVLGGSFIVSSIGSMLAIAAVPLSAIGFLLLIFTFVYMFVARAVFYAELKRDRMAGEKAE